MKYLFIFFILFAGCSHPKYLSIWDEYYDKAIRENKAFFNQCGRDYRTYQIIPDSIEIK
jgi:hypothetical protein